MKEYQVVCIDDDEQFLRSLQGTLPERVEPLCGEFRCVFDFVGSPQELFALLSEPADGAEPAMVISDQTMPGMTGIDLIERLKAERPDLVCVLLTGHAGLDSARYAINRRLLDQYVTKPIEDLEQFGALVANLLKRHHLDLEEKQRTAQLAATVEQLRQSNERIRAMHAAAEQVAMLSKGLKSLDFEEVVELIAREVPRIFQARWGVLCFPEDGCPSDLVRRQECPCPQAELLRRPDAAEARAGARVICGPVPAVCEKLGGQSPDVIIPLSVGDPPHRPPEGAEWPGYVCICRLDQAAGASAELIEYKGRLVQDVLSANLTNARLYQQARRDSQIDPLTGVSTRRVLEDRLEDEYERAVRYARTFSVVIVDVDRFKNINDQSGHAAGDRALRGVAKVLHEQARATDVLARYGGDEFVLLLPETDLASARTAAERMRTEVASVLAREGETAVTISCGVAEWSGRAEDSASDVLRRADAALYKAKQTGRNRVETAQAA